MLYESDLKALNFNAAYANKYITYNSSTEVNKETLFSVKYSFPGHYIPNFPTFNL